MEFVINVAIMMTPAIILIAVAICMVEEHERYERFLDECALMEQRKMERYVYDD